MPDVGMAMQRALEKTETMRARASAVDELEKAGTFDDLTQLGPGQDDIDRQLAQLSDSSTVDQEMAKLKAEVGSGKAPGHIDAPPPGPPPSRPPPPHPEPPHPPPR